MRGKYSWIEPGAKVGFVLQFKSSVGREGKLEASYDHELCDTATVISTRRKHGGQRWVVVEYDPPNFGRGHFLAIELRRLDDTA